MPQEWIIVLAIKPRPLGHHISAFWVLLYLDVTLFYAVLVMPCLVSIGVVHCLFCSLACSMFLALCASLFWLTSMHVLVSYQYVLGLFWVALAISFMLCIAVV